MSPLLIIIVLAVLAVIIWLQSGFGVKTKSREESIGALRKYTNARIEPVENHENSFRLTFHFEGQEFIFEDIQQLGFKGNIYKTYLKAKTSNDFNLNFIEKRKKSSSVRSDLIMASDITEEKIKAEDLKVKLPKNLQEFFAITNNIELADSLFNDKRIAGLFYEYKNDNIRGYPFISLKIVDGAIILEFHSSAGYRPAIHHLYSNIPSIEDYLNQMLVIIRKINNYRENI